MHHLVRSCQAMAQHAAPLLFGCGRLLGGLCFALAKEAAIAKLPEDVEEENSGMLIMIRLSKRPSTVVMVPLTTIQPIPASGIRPSKIEIKSITGSNRPPQKDGS